MRTKGAGGGGCCLHISMNLPGLAGGDVGGDLRVREGVPRIGIIFGVSCQPESREINKKRKNKSQTLSVPLLQKCRFPAPQNCLNFLNCPRLLNILPLLCLVYAAHYESVMMSQVTEYVFGL